MSRVHVCLAVTGHLHFWQNDQDLLCATAVTRGWNGYRNDSQHRKLTLEKKSLALLRQGLLLVNSNLCDITNCINIMYQSQNTYTYSYHAHTHTRTHTHTCVHTLILTHTHHTLQCMHTYVSATHTHTLPLFTHTLILHTHTHTHSHCSLTHSFCIHTHTLPLFTHTLILHTHTHTHTLSVTLIHVCNTVTVVHYTIISIHIEAYITVCLYHTHITNNNKIILIKCYSLTWIKLTALYKQVMRKNTLTYISTNRTLNIVVTINISPSKQYTTHPPKHTTHTCACMRAPTHTLEINIHFNKQNLKYCSLP